MQTSFARSIGRELRLKPLPLLGRERPGFEVVVEDAGAGQGVRLPSLNRNRRGIVWIMLHRDHDVIYDACCELQEAVSSRVMCVLVRAVVLMVAEEGEQSAV